MAQPGRPRNPAVGRGARRDGRRDRDRDDHAPGRLALHDHGVRPPVLQHPVGAYRIDLAYPDVLLGIEYDGEHHRTPEQAREDLARQAFLTVRGRRILRPAARDVLRHPEHVAGLVRHHPGVRGGV